MQQSQSVNGGRETLPTSYEEWLRQGDVAQRKIGEERIFQIQQVRIDDPDRKVETIAFTSKASAQKLIAALASQEGYRFRVNVFTHPLLPGMEYQEGR